MKPSLLILALLGALSALAESTPAAEPSQAEAALRAGDAAKALRLLQAGADALPAEEAAYWQGQALVRLGRPEEAAACFQRVPAQHVLYPYAARALLYCAWVSPAIDFVEVCSPLTSCEHEDIATIALAALAEYQLRYAPEGDTSSFAQLEKAAADHPELRPLVSLLTIHNYRRAGDFDAGLEYARNLEREAELSPIMRQRVRLAIAELYYAKEDTAPPTTAGAEPEESDEGKGEETLLQFITANPDSPLLQEAFRRLQMRGAVGGSEFTHSRLLEWAEDTAHPQRAALAFFSLLHTEPDSAAVANRVASLLPGAPLTRTILREQVRRLHEQGLDDQAALYLSLLASLEQQQEDESAHSIFARARQLWHSPAAAGELFRRSADLADASLQLPALVNSFICSLRLGDEEAARRMLQMPHPPHIRRELLLAHAAYLAPLDPARALAELDEVMTLHPTPAQMTDVLLDRCHLRLDTAPQVALDTLLSYDKETRAEWSAAQVLRYAALLEAATARTQGEKAAEQQLLALYRESDSAELKQSLVLHLAAAFSADNRHEAARDLLLDLAEQQPTGESKALSLFYAAQESSCLSALPALETAARLYDDCARQGASISPSARISQAAILVRINRSAEAFDLLDRLQQTPPALSPENQALLYTVQADAYGLQHTPEGTAAALECCDKIAALPGLSRAWYARALLQRASLCARADRPLDALVAYRSVMQSEKSHATPDDARSCFAYYYAGAGAVYQLLRLEQYSDAALLAEEIAAWPSTPDTPDASPGPKSDSFARWAQSIRQSYYVPIYQTPTES